MGWKMRGLPWTWTKRKAPAPPAQHSLQEGCPLRALPACGRGAVTRNQAGSGTLTSHSSRSQIPTGLVQRGRDGCDVTNWSMRAKVLNELSKTFLAQGKNNRQGWMRAYLQYCMPNIFLSIVCCTQAAFFFKWCMVIPGTNHISN